MKNVCAGLALTLVLVGCATNPTVRSPEQARQKAEYYQSQAAALEKKVERQNYVLKQLRERIKDARKAQRHYEKQGESAEGRLGELEAEMPTSEGEKQAIAQLVRKWSTREKHMDMSADERQSLVNFLQDQIRMQRRFRKQLRYRIQTLRKKADDMEQLADKLKAQEEEKTAGAL